MPLVGHQDPLPKNAKLQALAASVLPPVDKDRAAKLARAITGGSSTPASDVTILWVGKNLMLAHYIGGSFWGGSLSGTEYSPQRVDLMPVGERHFSGKIHSALSTLIPGRSMTKFWEGGKGKRLDAETLIQLVADAVDLDRQYVAVVADIERVQEAEVAKQEAQAKKERKAAKEHAADRKEAKRIAKLLLEYPGQNLNVLDLAKLVLKRGLA